MSDTGVTTALRIAACLAALAAIAAAPAALAARQVVGGSPVDVRDAPWNVVVVHGTLQSTALCSGSIIDPLHVLTAGRCVVDPGGAVASAHSFLVRAGVSNAVTPTATDRMQDRSVAAVRVHPGYQDDTRAEADDVAVLTLSSPLDLGGPNAQAIALPAPGFRLTIGQAVGLSGFGVTSAAGTGSSDVTLNRMSSTVIADSSCLQPPDDAGNAVILCAFSGTNSPCHGDSGSALVLATPTPVAVGVTGAGTCDPNTAAEFADLTAPEILQFVEGNDDPPRAPRPSAAPTLAGSTPVPQVGQTLHCDPGAWSEGPSLAYSFLEGTNRLVLRSGPSTYRLGVGDAGRRLLCRVAATSAGGTTEADSRASAEVLGEPDLSAAAAGARAGGVAVVRVALLGWAAPIGKATVCATSAPRVGTRTCRALGVSAGARPTVALRFPVKSTAPAVAARLSVTVRAADGRSAAGPAVLQIR